MVQQFSLTFHQLTLMSVMARLKMYLKTFKIIEIKEERTAHCFCLEREMEAVVLILAMWSTLQECKTLRVFQRLSFQLAMSSATSSKLMTWEGELYLELHNGTYTTMAEHKFYNRFMETLLRDTEILHYLSFLNSPQSDTHLAIKEMWYTFLID